MSLASRIFALAVSEGVVVPLPSSRRQAVRLFLVRIVTRFLSTDEINWLTNSVTQKILDARDRPGELMVSALNDWFRSETPSLIALVDDSSAETRILDELDSWNILSFDLPTDDPRCLVVIKFERNIDFEQCPLSQVFYEHAQPKVRQALNIDEEDTPPLEGQASTASYLLKELILSQLRSADWECLARLLKIVITGQEEIDLALDNEMNDSKIIGLVGSLLRKKPAVILHSRAALCLERTIRLFAIVGSKLDELIVVSDEKLWEELAATLEKDEDDDKKIWNEDAFTNELENRFILPMLSPSSEATHAKLPKVLLWESPEWSAKALRRPPFWAELLAKRVARDGIFVYRVNLASLYSGYVGDTEANIRNVFARVAASRSATLSASTAKGTILILEGVELIGMKSSQDDVTSRRSLLTTLLLCLDGIDTGGVGGTCVLGVSAVPPEKLEESLVRPGRFDALIRVAQEKF